MLKEKKKVEIKKLILTTMSLKKLILMTLQTKKKKTLNKTPLIQMKNQMKNQMKKVTLLQIIKKKKKKKMKTRFLLVSLVNQMT